MLNLNDIREAAKRIGQFIHKTPLIYSHSFSRMTGAEVFLKTENLQKTGSFKVRGACNILTDVSAEKVIAASMGNHGQGVAFAAGMIGKKAVIVMPLTSSIVKQEAVKAYGGEVLLHGESFSEALDYAKSRTDCTFIHGFDDDRVIAGQGTAGLEIIEEIGKADCVIVPVGGGGLVAGISLAVKSLSPDTEIIGVQSRAAQSAYTSFMQNMISDFPPSSTIADGIAVGRVGERSYEIIRRNVDDMVLVDEESIAMSILLFLERKKLVVEGAGAVPLAALTNDPERFRGRRVVLIVSGGNIDFTLIDRIIRKGLVKGGRIGVFAVIIEDVPGRLNSLTAIIGSRKGNILDIYHDRFAHDLTIGQTKVIITVETRGRGHMEEILSDLEGHGCVVERKDGC